MRKVYFEYRMLDAGSGLKHCLFKATHEDGRKWEAVVSLPFPAHNSFWDEDQYSQRVTRVSRKIAKEEGAPSWVME